MHMCVYVCLFLVSIYIHVCIYVVIIYKLYIRMIHVYTCMCALLFHVGCSGCSVCAIIPVYPMNGTWP